MEYQLPPNITKLDNYSHFGPKFFVKDSKGREMSISRNSSNDSMQYYSVDGIEYYLKFENTNGVSGVTLTRDQLINFMQAIIICISETESLYDSGLEH